MRRRVKKSAATQPAESTVNSLLEEEDDGPSFDDDEAPSSIRTERFDQFRKVAAEFKSFRPASEVLTRVKAVPTIFSQFDHATKVGGLPIERFSLVHGPSGEGKTYFTLGLLKSFLVKNHLACLIDAERTTPRDWVQMCMGDYLHHPYFFADRPKTYEKTVANVRNFVNTLRKLRDAGKVEDDTSAIIVVDSIRKLVPADIFAKITESGQKKKGDEKVRDRSAQIKAAMNSAWMDELIPLLEETQTGMVVIARETEDPDADARSKMFGTNFKVGGGKALYYDASIVVRVERAKYVGKKDDENDEKSKTTVYGERHRVTIRKTKVAGKEDRQSVCYYHTSNGVLVPEGFDRARDVLELARKFEIVIGTSWLKFGRHKWQGEHAAVKKLTTAPDVLLELEAKVREKFEMVNAVEHDSDGVVLD